MMEWGGDHPTPARLNLTMQPNGPENDGTRKGGEEAENWFHDVCHRSRMRVHIRKKGKREKEAEANASGNSVVLSPREIHSGKPKARPISKRRKDAQGELDIVGSACYGSCWVLGLSALLSALSLASLKAKAFQEHD